MYNILALKNITPGTYIYIQFTLSCVLLCFATSGTLKWRHNGRDGVSNHQLHDCLYNRLFRRRSKKTSKFRITGLCAGNSPVTGEFPAQNASNAEKVSIWLRHHITHMFQVTFLALGQLRLYLSVPMNEERNDSVCGLSQWETTLHYNVVSYWLSPYTDWFLSGDVIYRYPILKWMDIKLAGWLIIGFNAVFVVWKAIHDQTRATCHYLRVCDCHNCHIDLAYRMWTTQYHSPM